MVPNSTPPNETVRQYLSDLARLFSPSILREIARTGHSGYMRTVVAESGVNESVATRSTLADLLGSVYETLSSDYRCEYLYKNEILHSIVDSNHDPDESVISFEHRLVGNVLDALVINGTTTAYEIKTGLDNLYRLPDQLDAYAKHFEFIYVVSELDQIPSIEGNLPDGVGLIGMDHTGELHTVRQSQSHLDTFSNRDAFNTLHKREYQGLIKSKFGSLPKVAEWELFDACRDAFASLDCREAHALYMQTIKARYSNISLQYAVGVLPPAVAASAISARLSTSDMDNLSSVLDSLLHSA